MKKIIPFLMAVACFLLSFPVSASAQGQQPKVFRDTVSDVLPGANSGQNVLLEDSGRNILLSGGDEQSSSQIKIFPKVCIETVFMEEIWTLDHFQGEMVLIKIPPQEILIEVSCSEE